MGAIPLEEIGLTDKQEAVCRLLVRNPRITLAEIGAALGIKKSAASRLLSRAKARAAVKDVRLPSRPRRFRALSLSGILV